MNRRTFLSSMTAAAALPLALPTSQQDRSGAVSSETPLFGISLSQWSYHRAIFGPSREDYDWYLRTLHTDPDAVLQGDMDPRDIVVRAREMDVDAADLVNVFFFGHGDDARWLREAVRRADGEGVRFEVLMLDEAGHLGASDPAVRSEAVENHLRWMDAAASLQCRSIRANAYGDGTYLDQLQRCAESLRRLGDYAAELGLDVLVENHGHPSSNGAWLAMLVEQAAHPRVGVLADFDNFFMGGWGLVPERRYDTRQGMLDLAPYARALSAKSYAFAPDGRETRVDFGMCLQIALEACFRGMVSAEYEGEQLAETEGARRTVDLLRSERARLASDEH